MANRIAIQKDLRALKRKMERNSLTQSDYELKKKNQVLSDIQRDNSNKSKLWGVRVYYINY